MSIPLYEKHEVCEGRGCHLCGNSGFIETGLTRGQVDRLVDAAVRLEFRVGDIAVVRSNETNGLILFIITSIEGGYLWGSARFDTLCLIRAESKDCRRVGRVDRKEGEPC